MTVVWISAGGFLGAVTRACFNHWCCRKHDTAFPLGTFMINLSGSLLLGFFIGLRLPSPYITFLGTGFMGAFTTFSTFKLENVKMVAQQKHKQALAYIALTCGLGILLAFIGYILGRQI